MSSVATTHPRWIALFALLMATVFWAISFPFVKLLYAEQLSRVPEASIIFLATLLMASRFAIAAMMIAPWALPSCRTWTKNEWRQGAELAFYGGLGMWLQADALAYTKASTCAFLTQGYCILLPLFHVIKSRKSPPPTLICSVLMVLLGVAWLSGITFHDLTMGRGEWETLIAAIIFTIQILCLENPRYKDNRSLPITMIMFMGIAILTTPIALYTAPTLSACITALASPESLSLIASMSLFCSVIAFGLMNRWQSVVHSIQAGLIYCMEPVFTSLIALFLPAIIGSMMGMSIANETLTTALIGGGILITFANLLLLRQPHIHPKE